MTTGDLKPKIFRESAIRNNGSGKIYFFYEKFFSNRKSLRIWTTHSGIHGPKPVGPRVRTKKTRKSRPESELNIFQRFLMVHGPLFYDSLWATGFS